MRGARFVALLGKLVRKCSFDIVDGEKRDFALGVVPGFGIRLDVRRSHVVTDILLAGRVLQKIEVSAETMDLGRENDRIPVAYRLHHRL